MITTKKYGKGTKRYRLLARKTQRALRDWKKSNRFSKVTEVTRQIYKDYAKVGIAYIEDGNPYWTSISC